MVKVIESEFPDAYYYGCQSYGNIVDGKLGKDKTLIVCSVFEYETTKSELVYIDPLNPKSKFHSLDQLWEYCNGLDWVKSIELTMTYRASEILEVGERSISLRKEIQVFGAISINPLDIGSEESYLFTKKEGFSDTAAVAILLGGKDLNTACFYYNGWEGLGKHFTITKCDGKIIHEIDDEPAMNVYKKYLGIDYDEKFMVNTMQFPLLIEQHGVECVRLPMLSKDPNDIELTVKVKEGTKMRLGYGEPGTIISTVNSHVNEIFEYAPETVRIYSCSIRRLFWGDDRVSMETSMLDGIASTVGFYTRGELLRVGDYLQYFNATVVACLLREGDAVAPDYTLDTLIDRRVKQTEFSTKLIHYLGVVTTEIESQYNKTISGIANAYQTMLSINLRENTIIQFDKNRDLSKILDSGKSMTEQMRLLIGEIVIPSQIEEAQKYCDLTTLSVRMKNCSYIDNEFIGKRSGWFRAQFVVVSRDEKGELEHVIFGTQIIDEEKKREEQLLYLANTDELTGLANRRSYEMELISLKNSPLEERLIYVSMDINGLKVVNDTLGHAAGDELIRGAASCMKQVFGQYGKLYRIGGDEFCAIIFASDRQLEWIKKDLKSTVDKWKGEMVHEFSISVGYVSRKDFPNMTIGEIEKLADDLMYQEKIEYYKNRVAR